MEQLFLFISLILRLVVIYRKLVKDNAYVKFLFLFFEIILISKFVRLIKTILKRNNYSLEHVWYTE